jgi:hypothetical protein
MMKNLLTKHLLVAIASAALLSACGGGSGGGPSGAAQGPGNEGASDLLAVVKAMVSQGGLDNTEPQSIDSPKANVSDDKEPDSSR